MIDPILMDLDYVDSVWAAPFDTPTARRLNVLRWFRFHSHHLRMETNSWKKWLDDKWQTLFFVVPNVEFWIQDAFPIRLIICFPKSRHKRRKTPPKKREKVKKQIKKGKWNLPWFAPFFFFLCCPDLRSAASAWKASETHGLEMSHSYSSVECQKNSAIFLFPFWILVTIFH